MCLAGVLQEYDFLQHVASDMGIDQQFRTPSTFEMQSTLDNLAKWTSGNKIQINEEKFNYMMFNMGKTELFTRLTINNCKLDQVREAKLLGVWISKDLSWSKNCKEIAKKGYARIKMLSQQKYVGVKTEDLINIYILHSRSVARYCCTAFHSSLTAEQDKKI